MSRFLITGDKHGDFRLMPFTINKLGLQKDDTLIILGDAGINYYVKKKGENSKHMYKDTNKTKMCKEYLQNLSCTFFCIQGNHEARAENIEGYKTKIWHGGKVSYQDDYPNILFAIDGEVYNIKGKKTLVLGGAYSVDKHYRLQMGYAWFKDEQMSKESKNKVCELIKNDNKFDMILSHTCPLKYEPVEVFLPMVDQSTVDKTMEKFLQFVEDNIEYQNWYCGHYHVENDDERLNGRDFGKLTFMYHSIIEL